MLKAWASCFRQYEQITENGIARFFALVCFRIFCMGECTLICKGHEIHWDKENGRW